MTAVTRPVCSECGAGLLLSVRYDAAFCPSCDAWRESACADPTCLACRGRPGMPSGDPDLDAEDVWSDA
jgi:hypothetical protein